MNTVLEVLSSDHANFARLYKFIAGQAERAATGGQPDLEALVEAVEYLGDYPAHFHHPLENAICERIKQARPAVKAYAERLQHDHAELDLRLARFKKLMTDARQGREVAIADFVSAVNLFVEAERKHMESEDRELYPAAKAVLNAKDWAKIRERAASGRDPLFGPAPGAAFAHLRGQLAER